MTNASLIPAEQYSAKAWKNGQGETHEIARDPDEPFRWRVSLATLKDENQFSLYPGYERWIAFLGDKSVRLVHPATKFERVIAPVDPVRFSGDVETECSGAAGMRDFNLFVQKKIGRASLHAMKFAANELVQFPLNGREHFLYLVEGEIELEDRNSNTELKVKAGDTCRITRTNDKECLALRVKGNGPQNQILWGTIHLK